MDMLTMTLDIPEEDHAKTMAGFQKTKESGDGKPFSKTAYSHNLKLSSENEADILIHCKPTIAKQTGNKYRFFRIEFNPSKANLDNLKKNIDLILPGGYAKLMKDGIVTRIDLAVDALYLDATDIVASHPKIKVEKHYAHNGVIETKYLGAPSSSKQIVLYDKLAEIKHRNSKKGKAFKIPVPGEKIFRIEHRFFKLGCTLKDVASLPNPFTDLTLIAYPGSKSTKSQDPLWTLFLSACRFEGVPTALNHLNAERQEEFKKRLDTEGRSDWWKPEAVWQGLPLAINKIISVKGYLPSLPSLKS
ncbi:hypothetical protein [Geomonas limicola]|uniref:hypothetical protein n=1 Tax=Geomonas limicola TaxID=2740186 RepID=UPI00161C0C99|nr:hypothetical protein [Geomonas limicola]